MKNGIYGLKNMLSGRIEEIYSMATDGQAQRTLSALITKRGEQTGSVTENLTDKKLYKLGEHDIETGKIDAEEVPKYIPWEILKPIEKKGEEK